MKVWACEGVGRGVDFSHNHKFDIFKAQFLRKNPFLYIFTRLKIQDFGMKIQSIKSKLDPISRYVRLSFSTFPPFFSIMRKGPLVSAKGVKTPRGFCVKTVQGNEPDFLLVSLRLRLTKSTAIILKICGKSDFFSSFCWCRLSSPPNSLFLT